jgi:hypothetical protein
MVDRTTGPADADADADGVTGDERERSDRRSATETRIRAERLVASADLEPDLPECAGSRLVVTPSGSSKLCARI